MITRPLPRRQIAARDDSSEICDQQRRGRGEFDSQKIHVGTYRLIWAIPSLIGFFTYRPTVQTVKAVGTTTLTAATLGLSFAYSARVCLYDFAPEWLDRAESLARAVLRTEPRNALAYEVLGYAEDCRGYIDAALTPSHA